MKIDIEWLEEDANGKLVPLKCGWKWNGGCTNRPQTPFLSTLCKDHRHLLNLIWKSVIKRTPFPKE